MKGYRNCCELLSKFVIFAVANNYSRVSCFNSNVVNCFQNLLSLQSQTTKMHHRSGILRCELLSKFVIFAVANNGVSSAIQNLFVVNCFQNLLSLQSQTTQRKGSGELIQL